MENLIQTMKKQYCLLKRASVWTEVPEGPVINNLSTISQGYYLLDKSPFKDREHAFFLFAVEQHRQGMFSRAGEWAWDQNVIC